MRMQQVLYPCEQSWSEIFYDGELKVVNNVVEFDERKRAHWIDQLIIRGFKVVTEAEEPTSSKKTQKARKQDHGEDSQ